MDMQKVARLHSVHFLQDQAEVTESHAKTLFHPGMVADRWNQHVAGSYARRL